MTGDQYLEQILQKYNVPSGSNSASERVANSLYQHIKNWAGTNLSEVLYSGSYAKGTAVRTSRDLDLFISLSAYTNGTLEEIYDSLYVKFSQIGFSPRKQNVSIGLTVDGLSVDLIPARKQQTGDTNYHSLWSTKKKTWLQTNINEQINTIKNSGRTKEIKIIKLWRDLNNVEFPSFYLELTVLDALHGRSTNDLSSNVWSVLQYISTDNFKQKKITDPANSNNIVSDELSDTDKTLIGLHSSLCRMPRKWEKIVW